MLKHTELYQNQPGEAFVGESNHCFKNTQLVCKLIGFSSAETKFPM